MDFNDNSGKNVDDKLHKLCLVIDNINKRLRLVPTEECLAVNEQIIPFKGKSSLKQYNPKKPHNWGIKFLFSAEHLVSVTTLRSSLANLTTYVHQMKQIWVQVVMLSFNLQGLYLTSANYKLYIDNWFSSIPLQMFIYERGILLLGTVHSNRLRQCQLPTEKRNQKGGVWIFS